MSSDHPLCSSSPQCVPDIVHSSNQRTSMPSFNSNVELEGSKIARDEEMDHHDGGSHENSADMSNEALPTSDNDQDEEEEYQPAPNDDTNAKKLPFWRLCNALEFCHIRSRKRAKPGKPKVSIEQLCETLFPRPLMSCIRGKSRTGSPYQILR